MKEYKGLKYSNDFVTCFEPVNHDLKSAVLHPNTRLIAPDAFYRCFKLKEITFNEGLQTINQNAFSDCFELTKIEIPSSVIFIDLQAFNGCCKIKSIKVDPRNTVYDSKNNCNAIIKTNDNTLVKGCIKTVIPPQIEKIGPYAFHGCEMEEIQIPSTVKEIGEAAFENCFYLENINLPKSLKKIDSLVFSGNKRIKELIIPEGVEEIGEYAFMLMQCVEKINLPYSLKKMNPNNFIYCDNLKTIFMTKEIYEQIEPLDLKHDFTIKFLKSLDEMLDEGKSFRDANNCFKEFDR